jgi:hypothetical protein
MANNEPRSDVEATNRRENAPDDAARQRKKSELRSATLPASGAAVQHAFAGAELSADSGGQEGSETEAALKRAANR